MLLSFRFLMNSWWITGHSLFWLFLPEIHPTRCSQSRLQLPVIEPTPKARQLREYSACAPALLSSQCLLFPQFPTSHFSAHSKGVLRRPISKLFSGIFSRPREERLLAHPITLSLLGRQAGRQVGRWWSLTSSFSSLHPIYLFPQTSCKNSKRCSQPHHNQDDCLFCAVTCHYCRPREDWAPYWEKENR